MWKRKWLILRYKNEIIGVYKSYFIKTFLSSTNQYWLTIWWLYKVWWNTSKDLVATLSIMDDGDVAFYDFNGTVPLYLYRSLSNYEMKKNIKTLWWRNIKQYLMLKGLYELEDEHTALRDVYQKLMNV